MPHGMCYLWQPGVLGLHIVSDPLIALAYISIPCTLTYFVRKRTDLLFHWMFLCFAVFIVACGRTHLMEIWVIWHPGFRCHRGTDRARICADRDSARAAHSTGPATAEPIDAAHDQRGSGVGKSRTANARKPKYAE